MWLGQDSDLRPWAYEVGTSQFGGQRFDEGRATKALQHKGFR